LKPSWLLYGMSCCSSEEGCAEQSTSLLDEAQRQVPLTPTQISECAVQPLLILSSRQLLRSVFFTNWMVVKTRYTALHVSFGGIVGAGVAGIIRITRRCLGAAPLATFRVLKKSISLKSTGFFQRCRAGGLPGCFTFAFLRASSDPGPPGSNFTLLTDVLQYG